MKLISMFDSRYVEESLALMLAFLMYKRGCASLILSITGPLFNNFNDALNYGRVQKLKTIISTSSSSSRNLEQHFNSQQTHGRCISEALSLSI
jgi:hypothetical protein